jgi:hypothetical protein
VLRGAAEEPASEDDVGISNIAEVGTVKVPRETMSDFKD